MVKALVLVAVAALAVSSAPAQAAAYAPPETGQPLVARVLFDPPPKPRTCPKDKLVRWITEAGFKGVNIRVAWAVAMRESNGQPGETNGSDFGLFQINQPSWGGSKYWPNDWADPIQNAQAAFRMVKDFGWQPWGLRVRGGEVSYDFAQYGGWSDEQRYEWIVKPFERYWRQFPGRCKR